MKYASETIKNSNSTHNVFASLEDLLLQAEEEPTLKENSSLYDPPHFTWDRNTNLHAMKEVMNSGWIEGVNKIESYRKKIDLIRSPEGENEEISYYVDGGAFIDVGRFTEGSPECFARFHSAPEPEKVIKVHGYLTAPGFAREDQLFRYGAAISAGVDILESAGFRCELWLTMATKKNWNEQIISCLIKRPEQPLDLERLAVTFCHPAFERRIMFRVMETLPKEVRYQIEIVSSGGYGRPFIPKFDDCDLELAAEFDRGSFSTDEDTIKWINKTLEKLRGYESTNN